MPRRWSRVGDGMDFTAFQAFFDTRQQQLLTTGRLYALVDGLLYADQAGVPQRSHASLALFDRTPDVSLADAGPWLFDYEFASGAMRAGLALLAAGAGGASTCDFRMGGRPCSGSTMRGLPPRVSRAIRPTWKASRSARCAPTTARRASTCAWRCARWPRRVIRSPSTRAARAVGMPPTLDVFRDALDTDHVHSERDLAPSGTWRSSTSTPIRSATV